MQDAFTTALEKLALRRAAAEPGRMDHHHRAQSRHRSSAPRGLARRPARPGRRCCRPATSRTEEHAVRDDQLRLIFTCCHPALATARTGRADPAAARRPHHRRSRARLPRARSDDGAAARAREEQDSRCAHSVSHPERGRASRAASRRARGDLSHLQRGHTASSGDRLVREDLCAEAIRLGRLLARADAGRSGSHGPARADAAHRLAARRAPFARRRSGAAGGSESQPVGSRAHRRRSGSRATLPASATSRARTRFRPRSTPCTATQ